MGDVGFLMRLRPSLFAFLFLLSACNRSSPSTNTGVMNDGGTTDTDTSGIGTTSDTGATSDAGNNSEIGDTGDTGDTSGIGVTSDTEVTSDTGDTSDTGTTGGTIDWGPCGPPPDPFGGVLPLAQITDEPYADDANLAAVIAAAPVTPGTSAVSIPVDGAIVTNLGFPPDRNLWLGDSGGFVRTFNVDAGTVPVGARVSFTVTEITNQWGLLQITGLTNFEVIDRGHSAYVMFAQDAPLSYASLGSVNVHLSGQLTEDLGGCGASLSCFTLTHGSQNIRIRLPNALGYQIDDCLEVVAPLSRLDPDDVLTIENWDWVRSFQ